MTRRTRANILVVEDSLAAAKRLQSSLERAGFFVDIARDGGEAWKKTQRMQFDFVVTDEQMPVMSGREFCRQLRQDHRYEHVPIIFLTASKSKLDPRELSEDLGVVAVFEKPFSPELITNLIDNQWIAGSRSLGSGQ
jgi:CheY-like chemotaxis protein